MKNHTQNMVEKLFPDPFFFFFKMGLFKINSLNVYADCFNCSGQTNYIETKFQTIETKLQIIETNLSL